MPLARWIKNKNNRLVCVWYDEIKMSSVRTDEISPLVKSKVNDVFVAIFTTLPFGKLENIRTVTAKHDLSNFCKKAA